MPGNWANVDGSLSALASSASTRQLSKSASSRPMRKPHPSHCGSLAMETETGLLWPLELGPPPKPPLKLVGCQWQLWLLGGRRTTDPRPAPPPKWVCGKTGGPPLTQNKMDITSSVAKDSLGLGVHQRARKARPQSNGQIAG